MRGAFGLFVCVRVGAYLANMIEYLGPWSVAVVTNRSEGVRYPCGGLCYDYGGGMPPSRQMGG